MSDEKPAYAHDCDRCTFLGRAVSQRTGEEADLYHCEGDTLGPTVIARLSDHGGDYRSGLCEARPGTLLGVAKARAEARGLDVTERFR
jgi:hypothetical protein